MYRALTVDDDAAIRMQLKRMKVWGEPGGFELAGEATDGADAMNKLKNESFDLVITDIRMPKVDGIELLIHIIDQKLAPCVVFLSEHTEFRYAKQGLVYGAFDYLVKPVAEEDLRDLLYRARQHLASVRLAEEERQRSGSSDFLLPNAEISLLRDYMRDADKKSVDMAGIVAEKVLAAFGPDVDKGWTVLKNILQEETDKLYADSLWFGKFIDLRQVTIPETSSPAEPMQLIAVFMEAVRKTTDAARKFRCLDMYGPVVKEVSRYALENIDRNISANSIASSLFINRSYISQVFREKTGMTLGEYLTGLKMERAKALLDQEGIKIYELASRLGYKDIEYFSRLFKEHTGCSPAAYRDKICVPAENNIG